LHSITDSQSKMMFTRRSYKIHLPEYKITVLIFNFKDISVLMINFPVYDIRELYVERLIPGCQRVRKISVAADRQIVNCRGNRNENNTTHDARRHSMDRATPTTPIQRCQRKRIVIDLTSPSPEPDPKRRKKHDTPSISERPLRGPEQRLAPYRDYPPKYLLIKQQRALTQRMFLLERSGRQNDALNEDFTVLGSTGNVYTVSVCQRPR
jgi:hypothetical protein